MEQTGKAACTGRDPKDTSGAKVAKDGLHFTTYCRCHAIGIVHQERSGIAFCIIRNIAIAIGLYFQRITGDVSLVQIFKTSCATLAIVQTYLSEYAHRSTGCIGGHKSSYTITTAIIATYHSACNVAGSTTHHGFASAIVIADDTGRSLCTGDAMHGKAGAGRTVYTCSGT